MQSKHVKTILNLLIYVIGILLICLLLPKLLRFFMPFVIGWVIALIANPLVKFFEKRLKIVRKHGTWLVIVGVLAAVIGVCYAVISWLVREGVAFVEHLPEIYDAVTKGLHEIGVDASSLTESISFPSLSVATDAVSNLPNLLVQAIFMFLAAYFFIADKEKISAGFHKILPDSLIERWDWMKQMFSKAVGGYFVAQFKIMGVIAAILFVGFLILDVEYATLLALIIAFLDFIPFLGTGTAIWPWAAFQLATGDYYMAIGLMIIYLICLLVHQLLQPKFVGDTVGMDPLTTLIFMFIGYRISGVFGMIIAVPIGIILINLFKAGAFDKMIEDMKSLIEDFNEYRKK